MLGINYVWRQFDLPLASEIHVLPEEYAATLEELVALLNQSGGALGVFAPEEGEEHPAIEIFDEDLEED